MESTGYRSKWFAAFAVALLAIAWAIQGEAQPSHADIDNTPVNVEIFLILINTSTQYISSYLTDSCVILDSDEDMNMSVNEIRSGLCENYTTTVLGKLDGASEDISKLTHTLDNASDTELSVGDKAHSTKYLQDMLTPYLALHSNLTAHFYLHQRLLDLLKDIATKYFYNATDANLSIALSEVSQAIMALEGMRTVHNRLIDNVEGIRQISIGGENHTNPYIATLMSGLSELRSGYQEYGGVIAFFQSVLKVKGPLLTIEVNQRVFYLTGDLQISGAFICEGTSLADVQVAIWLDNRSMGTSSCEPSGYFTFSTKVPVEAHIGTNVILANLTFNDTPVASNRIVIVIEKVPVIFLLDELDSDYSKDDMPNVTGIVQDVFGKPLPTLELSIGLDDASETARCDLDGKFRYPLQLTGLGYGEHILYVTSKEDALYLSGGNKISFKVNQKTWLSLDPIAQTAKVGDHVSVSGTLMNDDGAPMDGKKIIIIADNATYITITQDGNFQTTISFDSRGLYSIHAIYISEDEQLRNATSSVQYISVKTSTQHGGLGYLPLFVVCAIILVSFAVGMAYVFARSRVTRNRAERQRKRIPVHETQRRDLALGLIEEARIYSGPLLSSEQEAVIRQYRSYLSYVALTTGSDLAYLTPSEVCALSIKSGAPAKEARLITRTFQKAYYTRARVDPEDIKVMAECIDRILEAAT